MPADPARTYAGAAFPSPADNDLRGRLAMTMTINFFLVPTRGPHPIPSPVASRPSIPLCHLSPPLQRTTKHQRSECAYACVAPLCHPLQVYSPPIPYVHGFGARPPGPGRYNVYPYPYPYPQLSNPAGGLGSAGRPRPRRGTGNEAPTRVT